MDEPPCWKFITCPESDQFFKKRFVKCLMYPPLSLRRIAVTKEVAHAKGWPNFHWTPWPARTTQHPVVYKRGTCPALDIRIKIGEVTIIMSSRDVTIATILSLFLLAGSMRAEAQYGSDWIGPAYSGQQRSYSASWPASYSSDSISSLMDKVQGWPAPQRNMPASWPSAASSVPSFRDSVWPVPAPSPSWPIAPASSPSWTAPAPVPVSPTDLWG